MSYIVESNKPAGYNPFFLVIVSHYNIFSDLKPDEWVAFGGPAGPNASSPDGLKPGTQIKMVRRALTHPSAHSAQGFLAYDVALVELLEPFDFNGLVGAICMADVDQGESKECVTAGWTDASEGGMLLSRETFSFPLFHVHVL